MAAFKSELAAYYRLCTQHKPTYQCFLKGWLNRAYKKVPQDLINRYCLPKRGLEPPTC